VKNKQVQHKFSKGNVTWITAMDEVRIERLVQEYELSTIKVLISDWPNCEPYAGNSELMGSLEQQV